MFSAQKGGERSGLGSDVDCKVTYLVSKMRMGR